MENNITELEKVKTELEEIKKENEILKTRCKVFTSCSMCRICKFECQYKHKL